MASITDTVDVQGDVPLRAAPESKQPKGLWLLFVVEMWERFSYYGMRAILVLYLVDRLGWSDARASRLYGNYTALVYLTPILGGWLADRYIGTRRSLTLGATIIAAGHFCLAFPGMATFYLGLGLIIIGTGFFKPNVSTMVGQLYGDGDPRRDAGFTIFYMWREPRRLPGAADLRLPGGAGRLALRLRRRGRGDGAGSAGVPLGPRPLSAGHRALAPRRS